MKTKEKFELYFYPEGYLYVADDVFDKERFTVDSHITTSCNNKTFPEDYNKMYGDFEEKILPQMKEICSDCVRATYKTLMCPNRKINKNHLCFKFIA